MMTDDIQKLRLCVEILDLHDRLTIEDHEADREMLDPRTVLFERAFAFARTTLEAMVALVQHGKEYGICVPTLCRPYYELSVRMLWASRELDGWQRLLSYWATEDTRLAKHGVKVASWEKDAQIVIDKADELLSQTDSDGNRYKKMPDILSMLEEIDRRDFADRDRKNTNDLARLQYTMLWGTMSRTVHGHMTEICSSSKAHQIVATQAAILATRSLLRATATTLIDPRLLDETVEAIDRRVVRILRGETDLGPD